MRSVQSRTRYRRDIRRLARRGVDISALDPIIDHIAEHGEAPAAARPHLLSGNWAGMWDCHAAPDWILIYTVDDNTVELIRTGTHSDLF